ncbi:MAG: PspC domain-containing protein [Candidatus Micrarchaeia archaeon]|jgi:phage shock protein PspC (stress-responsive transcriptional regulator)
MARKETRKESAKVRRLYRSSKDRILGGVCGGIADYYHMDPTIVRLVWIALAMIPPFYGAFILLYFIMWVIVPRK